MSYDQKNAAQDDDWGDPKMTTDRKGFPSSYKDGEHVQRVLPPIHSCRKTGEWCVPYATHTYSTPKDGDGKKKNWYTFECVEKSEWVNGERVVVQHCAECDDIKRRKDEYEETKKRLQQAVKNGEMTKDAAKTALAPLVTWLKEHRRDFKYYINTQNVDGTFGTRKVTRDVKKGIDDIAEKFSKHRMPWHIIRADQGLWLLVTVTPAKETANGFPGYKVEPFTEEVAVNGDTAMLPKKAPLSKDDYQKALASCWDLRNLGFRKLTPAKVQDLVDAAGNPDVIDAIFKANTPSKEMSPKDEFEAPTPAREPAPTPQRQAPAATPPAANEPMAKPVAAALDMSDPEALAAQARALLAQAERARAVKAAATPPATPPAAPPAGAPKATPPAGSSGGKPAASSAPAASADDGFGDLGADDDFFASFDTEQAA